MTIAFSFPERGNAPCEQVDNGGDHLSLGLINMGNSGDAGEGGRLSDGSPCLLHGCVACCLETEMPLTEDDLKRIEKLGFKRVEFSIRVEGETRLRNRDKACFFLEEGKCRIYPSRPEGCTIYPLVYDIDSHKFVYDTVCPHDKEFKATREDKERLKRLIRRLEKEDVKVA
jgi:Fe-S-cluster containining protein